MKLVGGSCKPQRRIIIENEHLHALFDMLQEGLADDADGFPIPVEFNEQTAGDFADLLETLCEAVIDKIALDPVNAVIKESKFFQDLVDSKLITESFQEHYEENVDEFKGLLAAGLQLVLTDAVKCVIDELLREAELFNLKKIQIKTRKHVIAIC